MHGAKLTLLLVLVINPDKQDYITHTRPITFGNVCIGLVSRMVSNSLGAHNSRTDLDWTPGLTERLLAPEEAHLLPEVYNFGLVRILLILWAPICNLRYLSSNTHRQISLIGLQLRRVNFTLKWGIH